MRYIAFIFIGLVLAFSACKKEKGPAATAPPADSAYFFRFTFGDSTYHFKSVLPDIVPHYANEIRGVMAPAGSDVPLIVLNISWPANHLVSAADVRNLKDNGFPSGGKLRLSFLKENNGTVWNSNGGQVSISEVKYLREQIVTGELVLIYALRGTCNATLSDGTNNAALTNGSFNVPVAVLAR